MRKNNKKSLLAGAVLASVLGCGFCVPNEVQAAQVNAVVGPKDFGSLIGKSIAFGQKRGYVENQQLAVIEERPTWQIIAGDNGSISLLANQAWGYNRFSDANTYDTLRNPGATVTILYYEEALKYLNDHSKEFFSAEGIAFLQNQTVLEAWNQVRYMGEGECGEKKFTSIFALPTMEQVKVLEEEKRKRDFVYWLADGYTFIGDIDYNPEKFHQTCDMRYDANTVQEGGSIVEKAGQNQNYIFPTIELSLPTFAMYGDKTGYDNVFKTHNIEDTAPLRLTFKDTNKEKNINISKLSVAQEGITFDANGLATGEGQGIGGLVENAAGNYLAYARLVDNINADGTMKDVEIKFNDTSITGNNTIHFFNEWIGDKYDLAGNFIDVGVEMNSNKISELTYLPNVQELILGDGVKLSLSEEHNFNKLTIGNGEFTYTAVNIAGRRVGSYYYTESQAVKVTEALDWANVLQAQGEIIFKGSFSVADDTLTLIRPTNTDPEWQHGITGWNDITYHGQAGQSATLKVKGKMHGLVVNGGTFAAEKDLILDEYLRVNNGAVLNLGGNLTTNTVNLNGTLNMTTADTTFTVNKDFTAGNGAKITGVDSTDKVVTGENLTAKGNIVFDKVTLEAAKNIQVQGNLDSNVNVSSNEINVRGNLSAERITSKNITAGGNVNVKEMNVNGALNFANGKAQNITVGALAFGESGKLAGYTFDVGKDIFTISNSASGKVKLSPKYGANLNNGDKVEVFNGNGDLSGLVMSVVRVTDTAGKKTYLIKQDASDRGKLNVIATKHNAAVNIGDDVKGQKVVFGNYWQENRNAKQPVLWSCVKHDGGQTVFLSDKILAETGGSVYDTQMWKITNFLKQDSGFVKELFTISEIVALSCVGEDALGLPSLEDVKDGGNYSWNADGRKAETTFYAGNGGRYYALGSTHSFDGVYVNDWVDSSNGDIGTYRSLWFAFGDGSHYGIRPTITFDAATVLFATNAESAKGITALGNFTRLKDVDENSTLELTFDDAYLAAKAGTERQTGDIGIGTLVLQGSNLSLKYSNAKYMDENSYVSCLIGESNLAEDYFGYGKADRVNKLGSDTLSINLANFPTEQGDNGYAMTLFNEYGNGTSFVGGMQVLPGSFRVDKGNLVYSIAPGDLTLDVQVGKGNILELTGTGVLAKKISGEGKVLVANNGISASGDQMVMDFETAEGVTMTITAGKVTGSLKGNFILQKENPTSTYTDVYFYGKSIEGHISSDKESNVFVLNKNTKVSGDLSIDHFKGRRGYTLADVYTLDMRQSGADTTSYNTLTIGKLHAGGKLAIDADLVNLQSDKIVLNGVDFEGNTITLSAVNITAAPETFEGVYTINNVATGSAKNAVVTKAGGLKVFTSKGNYTVTLENGNLKFDTGIAPAPVGLAEFIQSMEAGGSYSFAENQTLTGAVTTGNTDKGVFLNGNDLTGSHNEGITVAANHTLNIMGNGKISGFGTALKVENTGVLNLESVIFSGNTTDVYNQGDMKIEGSVTMETLKGVGTTTIAQDAELNLGGAAAQEITQTFAGEGTLNFNGDTTIAVDKLGTAMNTIATGKGLNLTSGGDNTLTKPVSGGGTIAIDEGNTIQTNADNLQVAVVNYGKLKIGVDGPGRISKGIIGGGTLEFAQHTIVEGGDILQNGVTVDENVAVETGKIIVPTEITNKGALLINAGDLQGKAVNSTDGGTFIVNGYTMYNGAVYLYSDGTEAGRKLEGRIANGKTMVMDEVRTEWDKLENTEIYINGDAKLTLYRSVTTAANIDMDIRGCKELDNGAGTGTLVTDGNFTANMDRVQVPLENKGTLTLNAGTGINNMGKMT
ncbi:MAG: hypothetical protein MJ041_03210, partial [Acidaminococcaceae bacterium]|nr:hypothetical protein [Acidaminococcaceae bacterium]